MKIMLSKFSAFLFLVVLIAMGMGACSPRHEAGDGHDHSESASDNHADETTMASYEEGKGIALPEETEKSLGLELAEVREQAIWPEAKLTAQVYRLASEKSRIHGLERTGNAYATALISKETAALIKEGSPLSFTAKKVNFTGKGVVRKIETTQMEVLGKAEAILELPDRGNDLVIGEFVKVELTTGKALQKLVVIPHSAVLETTAGRYAFVRNGSRWLRTEIKTGSRNQDFVEITDGLYEGDTIAVKPVEALYLIELRSTKGGGHSH